MEETPPKLKDVARRVGEAVKVLRPGGKGICALTVAHAFGLHIGEFAEALETTTEEMTQDPQAEKYQPALEQLERAFGLRAIFTDEEWQQWLQAPNRHIVYLDRPIDLVLDGKFEALGDFAENILTGAPM